MKKKRLNSIPVERRRIKWSSFNKTFFAFFVTIFFLLIFTLLVFLFSWLAKNFLNFIEK